MELTRRSLVVYTLLTSLWLLVVAWQVEEHIRFKNAEKTALRNRSKTIASTLGASIRGLQFQGAVSVNRLQPILEELVTAQTNEVGLSGEMVAVQILNTAGDPVASAGRAITNLDQAEIVQEGERWGLRMVTFVYPLAGASAVLLPPFTNSMRSDGGRFRRDGRPDDPRGPDEFRPPPLLETNAAGELITNASPPDARPRRPFWARRLSEQEYQKYKERDLHGLVLSMPIEASHAAILRDLWLRCVIAFFATLSAAGAAMAWRNLSATSDLQLRLVRASELNTHLKEMNLAAAGLAHETRNPLNIIRGLAHMISKQPESGSEIQTKSKGIIEEADKVAAQLNEFINYSRPREVRRSVVALSAVVNEVARALSYDLEEKKITLEVKGEQLSVEADEQMLRQTLFNLILNAIQATNGSVQIQVAMERRGTTEAVLEVRDNGPGVPEENRMEIFKPYFTTQKTGTGLGLAVVQQIVQAHGWEIVCLPNEPKGAIFRITHLKLA